MAALTLFPLQFKRQDSVPIDIDVTFATTAERVAYLSSPRRYAGQIVADLEEEKFYGLNAAKTAWIELGAGNAGPTGPAGSNGPTGPAGSNGPTGPAGGGSASNKWAQWPINCNIAAFYNSGYLSDNDVPLNDYTGIATTGSIPGLGTMLASSGGYGADYRFTPDASGFTILYLISYTLSVLGPNSAVGTFDVRGGTAGDYTSTVLFQSKFSVAQIYNQPTKTTVSFTYVHENSANSFFLDMNIEVGGDLTWAFTGNITITELGRTAN